MIPFDPADDPNWPRTPDGVPLGPGVPTPIAPQPIADNTPVLLNSMPVSKEPPYREILLQRLGNSLLLDFRTHTGPAIGDHGDEHIAVWTPIQNPNSTFEGRNTGVARYFTTELFEFYHRKAREAAPNEPGIRFIEPDWQELIEQQARGLLALQYRLSHQPIERRQRELADQGLRGMQFSFSGPSVVMPLDNRSATSQFPSPIAEPKEGTHIRRLRRILGGHFDE